MKRIRHLMYVLLLIVLFIVCFSINVKANSDLDYIHLYEIRVTPQKDGSLNMEYDIVWEVLDSDSEGPLSWVKIGIPNYHVNNLEALSDNIKKIKYYMDDGSFIRIDFKKNYYRGEIVEFKFKFNLTHMYHLYDDKCIYDYAPGYFTDCKVKECRLYWLIDGIDTINNEISGREEVDGYYLYTCSLDKNTTIALNYTYKQSYFDVLNPEMQYTDSYIPPYVIVKIIIVIVLIIAFIVVIKIIINRKTDPYQKERGFVLHNNYFFFNRGYYYSRTVDSKGVRIINPSSSSGVSSHGGSCACACACACAGGGRAGCTKKDFYNTNLKSEKVIKN